MFNLGISEMAFIALLALLLIGPKQLPEVARTLGRFLNDLKHSTNSIKDEIQNQVRIDQEEIRRRIYDQSANKKKEEAAHSSSNTTEDKKSES